MSTVASTSVDLDQRPASSSALWAPPRVVNVAVTRPDTTFGVTPTPAVEWQQRARADRRL